MSDMSDKDDKRGEIPFLSGLIQSSSKQKLQGIINEQAETIKRQRDIISEMEKSLENLHAKGLGLTNIYRSIEFPPEYKEAGTSILTYFSHILNVKYPDKNTKVKIEQEGLKIRMIIEASDGKKEEIEKTLEEYGLVVTAKMKPEQFLDNPLEILALKNKLELAQLEIRQQSELLSLTKNISKERINLLEGQVRTLFELIEVGMSSSVGEKRLFTITANDNVSDAKGQNARGTELNSKFSSTPGTMVGNVEGNIDVYSRNPELSSFDLRGSKFSGVFATDGGTQTGGTFIDQSSSTGLADVAKEIQDLLNQLSDSYPAVEVPAQADAEIQKRPALKNKIMGALKVGGKAALEELIDHPTVAIVLAAAEGWGEG